ncbi:MAG: nucleotide pyrophosphohydrolase [Pseudomonadota bacterium]
MKLNFDSVTKDIIKFRDDRDWLQYHDPKNLVAAISIEAAELQEIFLWLTAQEARALPNEKVKKVKEELADIFICMTYLCHHFGIDLLEAVKSKIQQNIRKYPVEKAKGSNKKYTELQHLDKQNNEL